MVVRHLTGRVAYRTDPETSAGFLGELDALNDPLEVSLPLFVRGISMQGSQARLRGYGPSHDVIAGIASALLTSRTH